MTVHKVRINRTRFPWTIVLAEMMETKEVKDGNETSEVDPCESYSSDTRTALSPASSPDIKERLPTGAWRNPSEFEGKDLNPGFG